MHMADALLSPAVGATFWAGTLAAIAYCSKRLKKNMEEKLIPLMGVLGAFIFASQIINFTIPGTGSSGHLGGGMILAVILGPYAAFIVMASVLTVQALFFADGGLLALGCNIWNLGIYPCFMAYPFVYKPLAKRGAGKAMIVAAAVISSVTALQLGAFSVVIETLLSGRSELPFRTFAVMMQTIHLGIGLIEGFVTAGVINFIKSERPEMFENIASSCKPYTGISTGRLMPGLLVFILLAGGVFSWFASSDPDGLEWSIKKVTGRSELSAPDNGIAAILKKTQKLTAFLPDYSFKRAEGTGEAEHGTDKATWPGVDPGKSVSGIVGSVIVLAAVFLVGFVIRVVRSNKKRRDINSNDF